MDQQPAQTHIVIHQPPKDYRSVAKAAWILLILTCGLAVVPFLGFASWFIATPILIATFVMSIVVLSRGGTLSGIFLLLSSIFGAPLFILIAPFVTSFIGAAGISAASSPHQAQKQDIEASVTPPPVATPESTSEVRRAYAVAPPAVQEEQTQPSQTAAATPLAADAAPDQRRVLAQAQEADRRLGSVYTRLRARLTTSGKAQLKQQQVQWLKFRAAQTGSGELLSQGIGADPAALRRFTELNEERASQLETTLQSMH